jgi:hypothetical protein
MGFATRAPAATRDRPWTPWHPSATAVLFPAEAWAKVPAETSFGVVAVEGELRATFTGVAEHPFGCDALPRQMAAFHTDVPLAEQVVWILPPGVSGAAAVPVVQTQADTGKVSWRVGPLEVIVRATGPHAGSFTVFHGDDAVHERTWEQPEVEGLALTLSEPSPGVPTPVAAFQLDSETLVTVVLTPGLEDLGFEIMLWREALVVEGSASLYTCAY